MVIATVSILTLVGCTCGVVFGVGQLLRSHGSSETVWVSGSDGVLGKAEAASIRESLTSAAATSGNQSRKEFLAARLASAQAAKYGADGEANRSH